MIPLTKTELKLQSPQSLFGSTQTLDWTTGMERWTGMTFDPVTCTTHFLCGYIIYDYAILHNYNFAMIFTVTNIDIHIHEPLNQRTNEHQIEIYIAKNLCKLTLP